MLLKGSGSAVVATESLRSQRQEGTPEFHFYGGDILTHIFSAKFGGKWRYQHGNHSAAIFFYDFQPLWLPCRYKGQRQYYPIKKDRKLNIEHCNLIYFFPLLEHHMVLFI